MRKNRWNNTICMLELLANLKQILDYNENVFVLPRCHMIFEMIKKHILSWMEEKVMRCDVKSMVAAHTKHYSKHDENKHLAADIIVSMLAFKYSYSTQNAFVARTAFFIIPHKLYQFSGHSLWSMKMCMHLMIIHHLFVGMCWFALFFLRFKFCRSVEHCFYRFDQTSIGFSLLYISWI